MFGSRRYASVRYAHQLRRKLSNEAPDLKVSRMNRASRAKEGLPPPSSGSAAPSAGTPANFANASRGILAFTFLGISYAVYDLNKNPHGAVAELYKTSGLGNIVDWFSSQISSRIAHVLEPSDNKLLPDFGDPVFYGQLPPGSMAPPLLVVDLEKTLIGSEYDVSMGWRHAKRPGLDRFINTLSTYYEVVIFSDSDLTGPEVVEAVDPQHRCHRLQSNAGELRNNRILKRLDLMNRDIKKIILIDDNEITSQLFPRNTLLVKPYTDLSDGSDTILFDLIPLLQAFVQEGSTDYRDTIDRLGTHVAEEATVEYQMRLSKKKEEEFNRRHRGLGKLIRNPSHSDSLGDLSINRGSILSSKDIVGSAPNVSVKEDRSSTVEKVPVVGFKPSDKPLKKKTGKLFEWIESTRVEKEMMENLKREKMNEIFNKRIAEKLEKENKTEEVF